MAVLPSREGPVRADHLHIDAERCGRRWLLRSRRPIVRGIRVSFFTTTPAVCTIAPRDAALSFVGVGTCCIGVTQEGTPFYESPQAHQSFRVPRKPTTIKTPTTGTTEPEARKRKSTRTTNKQTPTKNGIPTKVRAELLEVTLAAIRDKGDAPRDIQAVSTTLAKTGHANEDLELPRQTSVYVVAMWVSPHSVLCQREPNAPLSRRSSNSNFSPRTP